jgi:hypothetical protein
MSNGKALRTEMFKRQSELSSMRSGARHVINEVISDVDDMNKFDSEWETDRLPNEIGITISYQQTAFARVEYHEEACMIVVSSIDGLRKTPTNDLDTIRSSLAEIGGRMLDAQSRKRTQLNAT